MTILIQKTNFRRGSEKVLRKLEEGACGGCGERGRQQILLFFKGLFTSK
jgi:hypothetical protein